MRIAVGVEGGGAGAGASLRPDVEVMTPAGTVAASVVDLTATGAAGSGTIVYEAPLPEDTLLLIRASLVDGRTVHAASETVRTGGQCTGTAVFDTEAGAAADAEPSRPAATASDGDAAAAAAADADRDGTASPMPPGSPATASDGDAADAAAGDAADAAPGAEVPGDSAAPPPPPMPPQGTGTDDPASSAEPPSVPASADDDADGPAAAGTDAPPSPAGVADEEPGAEGGGCLIATAAYGTELAPQVQALREIRDGAVLSTGIGSAFVASFNTAYYVVSPQIADLEREHPAVRDAVRLAVAPVLYAAQAALPASAGQSDDGATAAAALYAAAASVLLLAAACIAAPAAARSARPFRSAGGI